MERVRDLAAAELGGARVGGSGALAIDATASLYGSFPLMLAVVGIVTFVLLARAFRSLLLAFKAIVLNLLSIGAAYGVLVLVWQEGHGSEAIWGIPATGAIAMWVPLMAFAFLYGLSMDYEVFLLARMREEYDGTGSTQTAIVQGLGRVGRLVTCAALILFLSFASMAAIPELDVKIMATALGAGILIDATILRALLVPALVALLGRWNWWLPPWAARVLRVPPSSCPSGPSPPAAVYETFVIAHSLRGSRGGPGVVWEDRPRPVRNPWRQLGWAGRQPSSRWPWRWRRRGPRSSGPRRARRPAGGPARPGPPRRPRPRRRRPGPAARPTPGPGRRRRSGRCRGRPLQGGERGRGGVVDVDERAHAGAGADHREAAPAEVVEHVAALPGRGAGAVEAAVAQDDPLQALGPEHGRLEVRMASRVRRSSAGGSGSSRSSSVLTGPPTRANGHRRALGHEPAGPGGPPPPAGGRCPRCAGRLVAANPWSNLRRLVMPARSVSWCTTASGRAAVTAASTASRSRASATTGSAPAAYRSMVLPTRRVIAVT